MKIGVLSDTHGEVQGVQQAITVLSQLGVSLLIHCGDIGLDAIPLFGGVKTHFVRGNTDDPKQLAQVITDSQHTLHDQIGTLEIEGRRVAFLHGHDVKLLHTTIHSGQWDLVCYGHTHAYSSTTEGKTLVLNPGALVRTSHPSLAVVDLPSLEVTRISLQRAP
jgi:uncharacterized protein